MVTIIQRLLQLLLLVAIGYFIVKPQVLPQPAQSIAYGAQRFVFGNEVSWSSFQRNWIDKWNYITTTIPIIGSWAAVVTPEPQNITADSIMQLIINTVLVQPGNKWNRIKDQLFETPVASSSTTATSSATLDSN